MAVVADLLRWMRDDFTAWRNVKYHERYVEETAASLGKVTRRKIPAFGITLGSGLDDLAQLIKNGTTIPYQEIGLPVPTVEGHVGEVVIGDLEGVRVLGLRGRRHYYEVADRRDGMHQVIFAVDVLAQLGVPNYFATNAAGGLNLKYRTGDLMAIRSHFNYMFANPLLGRQHALLDLRGNPVQRFQPMCDAYDPGLRRMLLHANPGMREGVYLAVSGPTYETEAESLAFRAWGADAVGMSTVPEVIWARNRGMRVVGMSCITNCIDKDGRNAANHPEVQAVLQNQETKGRIMDAVSRFFHAYSRAA